MGFSKPKWNPNNDGDQGRFPPLGLDFGQRTHLPFARLRFNTALPLVVDILLRKP